MSKKSFLFFILAVSVFQLLNCMETFAPCSPFNSGKQDVVLDPFNVCCMDDLLELDADELESRLKGLKREWGIKDKRKLRLSFYRYSGEVGFSGFPVEDIKAFTDVFASNIVDLDFRRATALEGLQGVRSDNVQKFTLLKGLQNLEKLTVGWKFPGCICCEGAFRVLGTFPSLKCLNLCGDAFPRELFPRLKLLASLDLEELSFGLRYNGNYPEKREFFEVLGNFKNLKQLSIGTCGCSASFTNEALGYLFGLKQLEKLRIGMRFRRDFFKTCCPRGIDSSKHRDKNDILQDLRALKKICERGASLGPSLMIKVGPFPAPSGITMAWFVKDVMNELGDHIVGVDTSGDNCSGDNSYVEDWHINRIAELKKLEKLVVCKCNKLTGKCFKDIGVLSNLTYLGCRYVALPEEGCGFLSNLKRLEELAIGGWRRDGKAKLDSAAIREIAKCGSLRRLSLYGATLSRDDITHLLDTCERLESLYFEVPRNQEKWGDLQEKYPWVKIKTSS